MLQALQSKPALGTGPWLDLGTGSGAIALGLASILPKAAQVQCMPAVANLGRDSGFCSLSGTTPVLPPHMRTTKLSRCFGQMW